MNFDKAEKQCDTNVSFSNHCGIIYVSHWSLSCYFEQLAS